MATAPANAIASGRVQNNTGDDGLTEVASDALREQLSAKGVSTRLIALDARLEALPEGGLQLKILCTSRANHKLLAQVNVKGRGASNRKLISSMMSQAARDLAADCR